MKWLRVFDKLVAFYNKKTNSYQVVFEGNLTSNMHNLKIAYQFFLVLYEDVGIISLLFTQRVFSSFQKHIYFSLFVSLFSSYAFSFVYY